MKMIINKLILKGYKRLFLNNIETLEYTPESNVQIIIGDNGSGKSSILKELSPLPADLKKYYREDGYKYAEIEHGNNEYIVSSGFIGKNKHSFVRNGEELNMSGIKKIQLELVKTYFNLDNNIFNIVLGLNKLTIMSYSERKKWLTMISNIDYNYPISVYNKIKQRHRDIVGGVKLIQSNIINYEDKILDRVYLDKLTKDIDALVDVTEYLISLYDLNAVNKETFGSIESRLVKLTKLGNKVLTDLNGDTSINTRTLETRRIAVTQQLDSLTLDISKIKEKLHKLDQVKVIDTTLIDTTLLKLNKQLVSIKSNITADIDKNNLTNLATEYSSLYTDILSNLNDIPVNVDSTSSNYKKLSESLEIATNNSNKYKTLQEKATMEFEHIRDSHIESNKVECKQCGNIFFKDYDEDRMLVLKKKIAALADTNKELEDKKQKLAIEFDQVTDKRNRIKFIMEVLNTHKGLVPIWTEIFGKHSIHGDNIESIISELNSYSIQATTWSTVKGIEDNIVKLEADKATGVMQEQVRAELAKENIDELDKELSVKIQQLHRLNTEMKLINGQKRQLTILKDIETKVYTELDNMKKYKTNAVSIVRNNELEKLVNVYKKELIAMRREVEEDKVNKVKLEDDIKKLEELKTIEKVTKIMFKELSPNEGLIAKSINSFLNIFINDINEIINTIWSYNMELLPCEVDGENDLDYKFRVRVDNNEVIEDVSLLSSSMQEIVDLAFKIVFMRYMNFKDFPLILDEVGRTFDNNHRTTVFNVIDRLLSSDFKQTFLVSHFEEAYLRFTHADINVVSSSNIDVKHIENYNQNFKIT